ncbi:glycogen synthase [Treponema peruense]|uniref:starch synthase n=1 Tax=Treponema peruense TaxID=2787628 RepID=A0A7T3RFE5_9SPIR|nr:glycogen/starch synthase [Treponema peruense]QQA02161.1 glycogen/starch synthase [Treponema peruense]
MTVWLVSREYAGIAEAGGVKNVACSLSESLVRLGNRVILFIPLYACTDMSSVKDFRCLWHKPVKFTVCGKGITITYSHGMCGGVEVVFVGNRAFSEKRAVYTYTPADEQENPSHKTGCGHEDAPYLNTLFQKAVAYYCAVCEESERPHIIHSQDATAALVPVFVHNLMSFNGLAASFYKNTKCVVTIHNAGPGYHHEFSSVEEAARFTSLPLDVLRRGLCGRYVEPFLLASEYACITTVSPEYAREIQEGRTDTAGLSQEFNARGISIIGITNGIDFSKYDPSDTKKSLLPYAFDPQKKDLDGKYACRTFLLENADTYGTKRFGRICGEGGAFVVYHGRVVRQKGIDVMVRAADALLSKNLPVKFIFMGQGERALEEDLARCAQKYEGKCVYYKGYNRKLARLVVAASDFSLHPSNFEPCGLEDFISQTFGTLPVAHRTGGLSKIIDDETGFLYSPNSSEVLEKTLYSLLKIMAAAGNSIFSGMISYASRYIHKKYSWDLVARESYMKLYAALLNGQSFTDL